MNTTLLFPNRCKTIGWILAIITIILWIIPEESISEFFRIRGTNYLITVKFLLPIMGGILISFSKEKIEDEFISRIRLSSWMWAVFINYILLALATIFIYDLEYVAILVYNMFTILVIFILRFNILLWKYSKRQKDEK